jgi:hypothetical protein
VALSRRAAILADWKNSKKRGRCAGNRQSPIAVLGYFSGFVNFLVKQAAGATLVCSVCTGSLLLGSAGLLDGHLVTTHWAFKDVLKLFKVDIVPDFRRYVQSGNVVTGAGISSGLDVAMYIVSLLYGVGVARQGQLAMQYNPQPAFHCGDPGDTDIKDDPDMVPKRVELFGVDATRQAIIAWQTQV